MDINKTAKKMNMKRLSGMDTLAEESEMLNWVSDYLSYKLDDKTLNQLNDDYIAIMKKRLVSKYGIIPMNIKGADLLLGIIIREVDGMDDYGRVSEYMLYSYCIDLLLDICRDDLDNVLEFDDDISRLADEMTYGDVPRDKVEKLWHKIKTRTEESRPVTDMTELARLALMLEAFRSIHMLFAIQNNSAGK